MHACSSCGKKFKTEEAYLAHKCKTGFTPKDIEHQDALTGGQFSKQSRAALARGAAHKKEG